MFEVGRDYDFVTGFGHSETLWVGEVTEVNLPLIKVLVAEGEKILNVGSTWFISASIRPYQSPEEKAAAKAELDARMGGKGYSTTVPDYDPFDLA